MFCRSCGTENSANAVTCSKCGAALSNVVSGGPIGADVPNYLVYAILVTLFCCLPFGIVGIVYAAQVNGKLAGGDYQGALAASKNAKTWTLVGFICGLVGAVLYALMMILAAVAGNAGN